MKALNVAIIGYQFMGKAHSNAWKQASLFFDLPATLNLKVACGRNKAAVTQFSQKWGWEEVETDWKKVIARDDIDIVDISLPQHLHFDVAIAAAKAGKHIFCEKPLALSSQQAREMLDVAEANGVTHYLNHNYRRTPAIQLAKRLINEGRIGRVFHWRGSYQQDWLVDPDFPLTWQLQKETAHAGPHWDLNSHSIDLAQFLVGEISAVSCITANFIKERPQANSGDSAFSTTEKSALKMGAVTVEDAAIMLAEFKNGAIGTFEATRFATGCKNLNTFEIYGSKGSLRFNLEKMNELEFFSREDPVSQQGFRTILVTEASHPYVAKWWPPGHVLGYEHAFVHAVADFVSAVMNNEPIAPNFSDGINILKVLEAGLASAAAGVKITV